MREEVRRMITGIVKLCNRCRYKAEQLTRHNNLPPPIKALRLSKTNYKANAVVVMELFSHVPSGFQTPPR